MLFAIDSKASKKIRATTDLPHASEGGQYRCTYKWCPHPEMVLRKGSHMIPHFAHKIGGGCDELSEAETERHLQIKDFMQAFLKVDIDAMEYAEIKGVRPDIHYGGNYVIELQCSSISDHDMIKRDTIYMNNGKTPVWMLDADEFLDEGNIYKLYRRLRVSERYALLMQGILIYFKIDKEHKTTDGYPTITLYGLTYDHRENFTKFRKREIKEIKSLDEFKALIATFVPRYTSFKTQILEKDGYNAENLYQFTDKWELWGKAIHCTEVNDIIGTCGRCFHVDPSSTETRCEPCLEAELLKRWKDIEPEVKELTAKVDDRNLIISGKIDHAPFVAVDSRNGGDLFVRFTKIDQMHALFKFTDDMYNQLKCQYENQLNKVNSTFKRVSPSVINFTVYTLLRVRKTKHTAAAEADD